MPGATALDVRGMSGHVHLNCSREPELPVLQDDGVLVLRDAIDRTIERPIEDDARRLAAHARVALREEHRKLLGTLLAFGCELSALNHARSATAPTARPPDSPFAWLVLAGGAQRNERAAATSRISHHELLRSPVAGDVRFTGRTSRRSRSFGGRSAFRELPISIHALAVGEDDRIQVARRRVVAIRRALESQPLTLLEHLRAPA